MQEVEGTNIKAPVPCKLLIHATVAQTMDADDHVVSFMRLLPRRWMRTIMLSTSAMSRVFTAMKMWMLYLAGKVTLNLRLRSRNKKGQGGCLRIAALRFEVAI